MDNRLHVTPHVGLHCLISRFYCRTAISRQIALILSTCDNAHGRLDSIDGQGSQHAGWLGVSSIDVCQIAAKGSLNRDSGYNRSPQRWFLFFKTQAHRTYTRNRASSVPNSRSITTPQPDYTCWTHSRNYIISIRKRSRNTLEVHRPRLEREIWN